MKDQSKTAQPVLMDSFHDGQVIRLTLNAPKGNVLDKAMMEALQQHLDSLAERPEVKLLLLTGAGKHFSFGASVPEHLPEHVGTMLSQFHRLFYTLIELALPTAALVSGQCLGGGLELALMCDFLFADTTARLGQPEIKLGVFPPPASLLLPLKIGQTRAEDLLLTGRTITAEEGQQMGIITAVFKDRETLEQEVEKWLQTNLLPKSASSLRHGVRAARWVLNQTLQNELPGLEKYYLETLMSTKDAREGLVAFLERRRPKWSNS
ncbi:MAG: enoyl-CoA hydratase-related protein [Fidelibacterota bacterium]